MHVNMAFEVGWGTWVLVLFSTLPVFTVFVSLLYAV